MLPFDYKKALYRRDNTNKVCIWCAEPISNSNWYDVWYGQLTGKIVHTTITSERNANDAVQTCINEKRKKGYKFLNELKDNTQLPVEEDLLVYLDAYLPIIRTSSDGSFLAMLAKTYDNENNKVFRHIKEYYGQYKINGLRCSARPYISDDGLFKEIRIDFQSREGVHWTSLKNLEDYLLATIDKDFINLMIDNGWALDGEVYLPGYTVNDINHFVKTPTCKENQLLQYWCYDLIAEDLTQKNRFELTGEYLDDFCHIFTSKEEHLSNNTRFNLLPLVDIHNDESAIRARDSFISMGFEGLIMRNPAAEYQFGKRNGSMIKFKKATDGKFLINDIKSEGIKRPDIPLFICKNDINDAEFECHVGGSLEYQRQIFRDRRDYIGKFMFVSYGERSGVNQLPFHVKATYIIEE